MKILFICTHNRCRSILAEAICNHQGGDLFEAASAGSQPAGQVHPMAIEALQEAGIPTNGLLSKSWNEVENYEPDFVITVCDNAAREACPVWFGKSLRAHWSLADPSAMTGNRGEIQEAFRNLIQLLQGRITKLHDLMQQEPDRTRILEMLQSLGSEVSR